METVKVVKIKFSELTRLTIALLIARANAIIQSLTNNPSVFTTPPYSPMTLAENFGILNTLNAHAESDAGSKNDRNDADILAATCLNMLMVTGAYVANVANAKPTYAERKAVVELASYTVANDTRNPVEPVVVTGLKAEVPTTLGERSVKFRWKRGKCDVFIVEGLQGDPASPSAEWTQLLLSKKAQCELTFEPGIWSVRVVGIYSSGQAAPSTDVSFLIS